MSYKDILVYLDRTAHSSIRLETAAALAAQLGAGLIGLRLEIHPHIPTAIRGEIPASALEAQSRAITEDTRTIEEALRAAATRHGVPVEWWLDDGAGGGGAGVERVCHHARHAGLTVVGQSAHDHEEDLPGDELIHHLLLSSGRPVLVTPDVATPPKTSGRRVAVAWNDTREASRALADALPILAAADAVLLVSVGDGKASSPAAASLAAAGRHATRNGARAETLMAPAEHRSVGVVILDAASEFGADLLVMGGYGHSRLREVVLGGATRHVLRHAGMPVMMSH